MKCYNNYIVNLVILMITNYKIIRFNSWIKFKQKFQINAYSNFLNLHKEIHELQ